MATQPLYIVWNGARNEAFVTDDRDDAEQAATGEHGVIGSTLAEAFYEAYGDDEALKVEEITVVAFAR